MNIKIKIVDASYHRNGVAGYGFHAILFDNEEKGRMIASLFDEPNYCAVYKVDELVKENIAFARGNSWRGDRYEEVLRPALAEWKKEHGSNQVGPFSMPDAR